jgi:hypothetical protein
LEAEGLLVGDMATVDYDGVFQNRMINTGLSAAFNGTIDVTADIDDHGRPLQPEMMVLVDFD